MSLDCAPGVDDGFERRVIVWLEGRASFGTAAPVKPAPFSAQDVNERVPDRPIAASHRLRELFRRQLRNDLKEFPVGPVAIVIKTLELSDCHMLLQSREKRISLQGPPRPLNARERVARAGDRVVPVTACQSFSHRVLPETQTVAVAVVYVEVAAAEGWSQISRVLFTPFDLNSALSASALSIQMLRSSC